MYNLTNLTAASNFYQFAIQINNVTQGVFVIMVIVATFIISFSSFKVYYMANQALVTSLYLTSLIALLFFAIGMLPAFVLIMLTVATALATVFLYST